MGKSIDMAAGRKGVRQTIAALVGACAATRASSSVCVWLRRAFAGRVSAPITVRVEAEPDGQIATVFGLRMIRADAQR